MRRVKLVFVSMILASMLLTACNPIKEDSRATSLRNVLWAYEKTLRWGGKNEMFKAWAFQSDELQISNPPPGNLSNIRISGYTQVGAPVQLDEDLVEVTARIDYILNDRQIAKELLDRQRWHYNDDKDGWERITPVPGF